MSQENILYGPPDIEDEDSQKYLGTLLYEKLTANGNRSAQVDSITGRTHTFSEIASLSLRLAENMRYGVGIQKWHLTSGDCVGICSENTIDFCIPVVASIFLGAAVAPLNPAYTIREMEHALNISKPKVVFCSKIRLDDIIKVASATNYVKSVIVIDEIKKAPSSNEVDKGNVDERFVMSINSLLYPENKFVPSLPLHMDFPFLNPKEHVALIMCSSGTTGLPKGVMLTHQNIITVIRHQKGRYIHSDDVVLGLLPFFHAFGLVVLLIALAVGTKVVVMPRFDGDLLLNSIEKHKVTVLYIVPPLAVFIAKDPRVAKHDLSSVRDILCGAAPLGEKVQLQVESIVTNARAKIGASPCALRQGYGLTETTLGVLMAPLDSKKYGSTGVLAPGTQCKVVDLETGKTLGPNKEGELCFRGPLIMKGYIGNVEATSSIIDKDGWLWTGDVGYYDETGHFYIVDRLKELIKYKGFQVPPAELEAILITHPAIEDAAVIGIPDEAAGELPMAMVVKQPGKDLTEAEVIKFITERVSPQKRLSGGVKFVKTIPKTASGKILRRVLRESFKSKL